MDGDGELGAAREEIKHEAAGVDQAEQQGGRDDMGG